MGTELRIGFLGAGKIATALAKGFVNAGLVRGEDLLGSDPSHRPRAALGKGVAAGPSQTWIILDAAEPHPGNPENYPNPFDGHGAEGGNVVFADGHAEWIARKKYPFLYELSEDEGRNGP